MVEVEDSDLMALPIDAAVYAKYLRGRREHGPSWVGPRPVACLHEELLDALVYVRLEKNSPLPEWAGVMDLLDQLESSLLKALDCFDKIILDCGQEVLQVPFEVPQDGV